MQTFDLTLFTQKQGLYLATKQLFADLGFTIYGISQPKSLADTLDSLPPSYLIAQHHAQLLRGEQDAYFVGVLNQESLNDEVQQAFDIQAMRKGKYQDGLGVFALDIDFEPKKADLVALVRMFNRNFEQSPVILLMRYLKKDQEGKESYHISIASAFRRDRLKKSQYEGEVVEKVTLIKDISTTLPHRGHIQILKEMKAEKEGRKITSFDELYQQWLNVFDLNVLNKKFYKEVADWYLWASKEVKFPQIRPEGKQNEMIENAVYQQESVLRLFTRLLFCWFMKEMQLIHPKTFEAEIMKVSVKDFGESNNYYKAILQNLFFATLSVKMEERKFIEKKKGRKPNPEQGNQYVFRYEDLLVDADFLKELFETVPFLNGGLFECLDKVPKDEKGKIIEGKELRLDGFSSTIKRQAQVPDNLFFGQSENKVQGIIKVFEKYKFTIAENTPLEEEVALDPEMLGKVFENLLAYHNPETGETARKSTGSFYTPREIVDYMVEESLLASLKEKINVEEERLRTLFSYHHLQNPFDEQESKQLIEAIYSLRILDPACGSGAFPMGILQRLVFVLNKLDAGNEFIKDVLKKGKKEDLDQKAVEIAKNYLPKRQELKKNKEIVQTITIEEIRQNNIKEIDEMIAKIESAYWLEIDTLEKSFDPNENEKDYGKKLYLIQDCIYGIDVQTIAIHISKLRFFLSLLIEQKKDATKKDENYGIIALPNLDTKLIAANTLIAPEKEAMHSTLFDKEIKEKKEKLNALRKQHIFISEHDKKEKAEKDDQALQQEIANLLWKTYDSKRQFKDTKEISDYISQVEAQIKTVQDQIKKKEESLKGINADLKKAVNSQISKLKQDIHYIEAQTEIKRWKKQLPTFIDIEKAASYAPYDQNKSAPFFDSEWMFGIKDGFDIVIGNPPYVQLQKEGGKLAKMFEKSGYQTFERTGDIYALFYEKAHQILKNNGLVCFITSNKWMRTAYGESLRKFFLKETNPLLLLDFGGVQVFESATVDTNILLFQKGKNQQQTQTCVLGKNYNSQEQISDYFRQNKVITQNLTENAWVVLSAEESRIKQKIEAKGIPLKDWDIQINYGIKTGFNEAFIIDGQTKDALIAKHSKSAEIIRPILRGRDIKKYKAEFADLYLIATLPSLKIDIEQYPAIKEHLLSFGKERLEQSGNKKSRKKTNHKWFETQDSISYWEDFSKQKIVYPNMSKYLPFVYDNKIGYFSNDKSFIITGKHIEYLVIFFNSSLFKYCFRDNFPELQGGTRELRKIFFDTIRVKQIPDLENEKFARKLQLLLDLKTQNKTTQNIENELDNMIFDLYEVSEKEREQILNSDKVVSISQIQENEIED
jgi:hypothetical protein